MAVTATIRGSRRRIRRGERGLAVGHLQAAHNLTALTGGQLSVLYAESTELPDKERETGTRNLHECVRKLPAVPEAVHVLAGNPETSLPRFAKRHGYDAMLPGAMRALSAMISPCTWRMPRVCIRGSRHIAPNRMDSSWWRRYR